MTNKLVMKITEQSFKLFEVLGFGCWGFLRLQLQRIKEVWACCYYGWNSNSYC